MKKKTAIIIFLIMSVLFLVISGLLLYAIYLPFFVYFDLDFDLDCSNGELNLNCLPTGDLITQSTSPDGKYTIKAYVWDGGVFVESHVRCELHFNHKKKEPVNIYWNYDEDRADLKWIDKDTVIINGHELDVPYETLYNEDLRHQ